MVDGVTVKRFRHCEGEDNSYLAHFAPITPLTRRMYRACEQWEPYPKRPRLTEEVLAAKLEDLRLSPDPPLKRRRSTLTCVARHSSNDDPFTEVVVESDSAMNMAMEEHAHISASELRGQMVERYAACAGILPCASLVWNFLGEGSPTHLPLRSVEATRAMPLQLNINGDSLKLCRVGSIPLWGNSKVATGDQLDASRPTLRVFHNGRCSVEPLESLRGDEEKAAVDSRDVDGTTNNSSATKDIEEDLVVPGLVVYREGQPPPASAWSATTSSTVRVEEVDSDRSESMDLA